MKFSIRYWLAQFAAQHSVNFAAITRIPFLGPWMRVIGRFVVPPRAIVWVKIKAGAGKDLWMEVNPRTAHVFLRGEREPTVEKFIQERLKPDMVFYDLGANCGFFSLIAAQLVGNRGKIYSFEPESRNAERMRANLQRNGFEHFTIMEAAVWRETGRVSFTKCDEVDSPDQGTGQITTAKNTRKTIQVQAVSLDDFIKTALPPDMIKCDVEGAEVEVFRGATQTLARYHPTIVCEIHSSENGLVLRKELASYGYTIRDLDESHICAEQVRK